MTIFQFQTASKGGETITVDAADQERVLAFRWYVNPRKGSRTLYAQASIPSADGIHRMTFLHRYLLGAKPGDEIDHIDGDGLNNCRANLRFVDRSQNIKSAWMLPGRYGNPTDEELDRQLEEWEANLEQR